MQLFYVIENNDVIVSNAAFGGQSGEIVAILTWDEEASRVWFVFHQVEKCSGDLANVKSKIWSYIAFITWRVERAEVSTELLSIPNIACNVAFHLVFWSSGHHLDVDAGDRDAFFILLTSPMLRWLQPFSCFAIRPQWVIFPEPGPPFLWLFKREQSK